MEGSRAPRRGLAAGRAPRSGFAQLARRGSAVCPWRKGKSQAGNENDPGGAVRGSPRRPRLGSARLGSSPGQRCFGQGVLRGQRV